MIKMLFGSPKFTSLPEITQERKASSPNKTSLRETHPVDTSLVTA
jgi:hypothetical protein